MLIPKFDSNKALIINVAKRISWLVSELLLVRLKLSLDNYLANQQQ